MKLDIYINEARVFCRGGDNLRWAFGALAQTEYKSVPEGWFFVQTIDIDLALVDTSAVLAEAVKGIDEQEREVKAKYASAMATIERQRGELLALPGVSK